jgi:hypothetical protein
MLAVECDVANEVYEITSTDGTTGGGGGNDCFRLDPHPLSLLSVSGLMGPGIPDLQGHVAYTARGQHLMLFDVYPYWDRSKGNILGSYTYVSDFILAGSGATAVATPTMDAGTTATPPGGRDPRCPANPPSDGDPCSPDLSPIECEYGGDAFGQCTTFAECALSYTDGAFRFRVAAPTACAPPNPQDCPASFALATSRAPQNPSPGSTCYYPEGVCGCVVPRAGVMLATMTPPCTWICRNGASGDSWLEPGCPWPRPLAGDPCATDLRCDYDGECSGEPSLGPGMICQQGHWLRINGMCS